MFSWLPGRMEVSNVVWVELVSPEAGGPYPRSKLSVVAWIIWMVDRFGAPPPEGRGRGSVGIDRGAEVDWTSVGASELVVVDVGSSELDGDPAVVGAGFPGRVGGVLVKGARVVCAVGEGLFSELGTVEVSAESPVRLGPCVSLGVSPATNTSPVDEARLGSA